ncbi:MAG: N-acetylglucosamine-6-phosphate deacetylase [Acidobacteriota bacterium]|nr:MAG: N-acetylglucosamine-6-phosphate deacetylase [Acidobacteriota bacterium]
MNALTLTNAGLVMPFGGSGGYASVRAEDGVIAAIGGIVATDEEFIDLGESLLLPGFIDIHCHGAAGADVNEDGLDGLIEAGRHLAREGVTAWVPTLVPDSHDNYSRAVKAIDELMRRDPADLGIARVLGVHYEGVFANENRCGALRKEYFLEYSKDALAGLPLPSKGVKMMTLAPEIEGGIDLVEALVSNGWIAAAGHTSATAEVLDKAWNAGLRHLTHFFNAMDGIHHRSLGVAGWGLAKDGVTFDVIADGHHVHPSLLAAVTRARGTENVILISDSISAAGLGDGEFEVWGKKIGVSGGVATDRNGTISGSVISMKDAFNLVFSNGSSFEEASAMASLNPASLLGIDRETGSLEVNKTADLTAWREGEVVLTVIGGKIVHNAL